MASKQLIPVAGLQLMVYGLEEYKALDTQGPVAVMFALHGRLENMSKMENICQAVCGLNNKKTQENAKERRHIIVIAFDHPNHGTRLIHSLGNFTWKQNGHENPFHAQDMWSMFYSSSQTISGLIDIVEDYLFGPQQESRVQVWGVTGFSMGGHASFMAAANDPRITVAIPIVGTSDYLGLMRARIEQMSLPQESCLPANFVRMVQERTRDMDKKLSTTKLLMVSGEKDNLVPGTFNNKLVNSLRKRHVGKEGYDWGFVVVPNVGHEWCPAMIDLSIAWCDQWMARKTPAHNAILPGQINSRL